MTFGCKCLRSGRTSLSTGLLSEFLDKSPNWKSGCWRMKKCSYARLRPACANLGAVLIVEEKAGEPPAYL